MADLDKTYDPAAVEGRWYEFWMEQGFFHGAENAAGPRFSIVIPPPNVTGSLTMGHVLNNTLQDVLVRYRRMRGDVTMWMPGTDHAGIATQNVVEREIAKQGLSRHQLGREEFLQRVWAWKEQYGSRIMLQLRRLGTSLDWPRERFTMDPGLSQAVREAFVRLHEKGLIYRGHRIIHWCPRCLTALSDEEAIVTEGGENGSLWHVRYPAEDGGAGLVVATTRPETMLGDTGVAVNPEDERYRHLVGKKVVLPLLGRVIPVVADDHVDPSFGTGAVKVTPAHDANDFEMARRHDLPSLCIMSPSGIITDEGGDYAGLDRFEARKRVVADLEAQGLLVQTEAYRVPIRRCERCQTVIEPYLSDQWFVRMKPLAEPAIEAVRTGRLRLTPERWVGVYLHWLENIRDWCISRQLWWGHRIPVWYCECGHEIVAREDPASCPKCGSRHLHQEEDVLDTWFSSWLWPFSTMGWPQNTPTLERFYPTDVLITAGDIIFFWVARMVMAGYEFMADCPFHTVFFNSVVRDLQGRKMSKSLGNSPDPIEVIEEYGADALRFTVVTSAPPGEDVRFSKEKTEFGRNFANKIWNAARFALRNVEDVVAATAEPTLSLADRWIRSRLERVTAESAQMLEEYRFNEGAMVLYRFIWGEFCDWYVELSKQALYGDDPAAAAGARATLLGGLERLMRLLHPYMPFLTEEIWQALPLQKQVKSLMIAPYPLPDETRMDTPAENAIEALSELVRAVRNIRSELGLPPTTEVQVRLRLTPEGEQRLNAVEAYFRVLAKVGSVERIGVEQRPSGEPSAIVAGIGEVYVPLHGVVDLGEVRSRIERDLKKVEKEISVVSGKLGRPDFVEKAPPEVVEKERQRSTQLEDRRTALRRHLETLSAAS